MPNGPLAGVRVIDFSRLAPGPYCSMLLADMGADVVRVDRSGDTAYFGDVLGRGKRSIVLDLKSKPGRDIASRLIDSADVVLEGFRPGVMERLGLGPEPCLERNARLVYARLTGWGQDGPRAQRAGHDLNYIAMSGVLDAIGRHPPLNLAADFAGGGLSCAFGIVCALLERQSSGRGQVVDAAMSEGSAHLLTFFAGIGHAPMLAGEAHFYRTYETSDGSFVAVGAIEPQFYAELVSVLGIDDAPQMDAERWPELAERFAAVFRTRTRDEWTKLFEDRDACVTPVLTTPEATTDAHNAARNAFYTDENGVTQPSPAPRLSRTPPSPGRLPPAPGEHTDEILRELGLSASD